jgi:hypothetical protein
VRFPGPIRLRALFSLLWDSTGLIVHEQLCCYLGREIGPDVKPVDSMLATFLAIYGPVLATAAVVMAFARTGPDEARSKLSQWADSFGLKAAAGWLNKHSIDARVWRYGKGIMVILVFVGGFGFGSLFKADHETSSVAVADKQTTRLADDASDQLRRLQYERYITLGRISFFNMFNALSEASKTVRVPPKQWIVISSVQENALLEQDINALFFQSWAVSKTLSVIDLPNYDRDLDAPKFEGSALPGITIHGRTVAAEYISGVLGNCFSVHQTAEMPTGVTEYYARIFPKTVTVDDVFTWLEVGKGSPWKSRPCIGPGN